MRLADWKTPPCCNASSTFLLSRRNYDESPRTAKVADAGGNRFPATGESRHPCPGCLTCSGGCGECRPGRPATYPQSECHSRGNRRFPDGASALPGSHRTIQEGPPQLRRSLEQDGGGLPIAAEPGRCRPMLRAGPETGTEERRCSEQPGHGLCFAEAVFQGGEDLPEGAEAQSEVCPGAQEPGH